MIDARLLVDTAKHFLIHRKRTNTKKNLSAQKPV